MGEVYKARDTNLKRAVAVKVLPASLAADVDRLGRFQREAEILAALNHPNIAAIYGLERSGATTALVIELVEGPTLADRIAQGTVPIEEALSTAKQIAEALEAAHEQGIIHRDLKPANIKVRSDGTVKVLDFGLAKATDPPASSPNISQSPTIATPTMTAASMILGTAAYMSPEQARGKPVDKRTDIWAFGCVLYEMLAGRPPFEGDDLAGILACVIEREPDWSCLPANVPARARELLRHCLEKNPKNRRRDAGDVRIDIERALADPAAHTTATGAAPTSRAAWLAAAVATLAVVGLSLPVIRYLRDTPGPSGPEMRVEINPPPQSAPLQFALSPNGRHIVFVASVDGRQRLWLRALNKVDAQAMTGTDGAAYPFWSSDSRSIGYFASRKLYRIDVGGGPQQELADVPVGRGGTWNTDGTILFAPTDNGPLMRIAAAGSEPGAVTHLDPGQTGHQSPQFLPDGRHFLFLADGSPSASGIYLGSLDGGAPKRLMASDVAAAYLEPNLVVFVERGALMARHLDIARGELTGDSMTLADAVGYDVGFKRGAFSVSADGHVAYQTRILKRDELFWVDRTGGASRVAVNALDVNRLANPDLSPNGRRVAVTLDSQSNIDIWLMDLVGGGSTRFTFDEAADAFPLWSPDGSQIVFSSARTGTARLYLKPSNGTGDETLLLDMAPAVPQDWSKDGRFLLYGAGDPKTGGDLWTLDMTSKERTPRAVVKTSVDERNGQFSPDGHWLAYETNESGRFEIVAVAFPDPIEKWPVSTRGGTQPRWRADGKELYFLAPDGQLMATPVTISHQAGGSRFEAGAPVPLFQTRMMGNAVGITRVQYAVSRDGRFLISQPAESATTPITLILNWKPPASEITR